MATTTLPEPPTRTAPRRRRTLMLLAFVAVLAVIGGVLGAMSGALGAEPERTPPGAPPRLVDSVGHVDGSTALVAVLARGDEVTAYVCDGDTTTGERFSGTLLGDRAVLHSAGGAQLTVDVTDGGTSGTFTPAGATAGQAFRTVPSTGDAGWYAAEAVAADGPVTANWVVLADGTQTGLENVHKHKRHGHKIHIKPGKPGKPSGVSPKPGDGAAQPDGELVDGVDCSRVLDPVCEGQKTVVPETLAESPDVAIRDDCAVPSRVCAVRGSVEPLDLGGGTVLRPVRVITDVVPPAPSGDPQSLAGN